MAKTKTTTAANLGFEDKLWAADDEAMKEAGCP